MVLEALTQVLAEGEIFIIDTLAIPVCKRARARRCRKLHGRDFYGYCASKDEHCFGWQLHLVCDAHGIPVSFDLLPARWDELNPLQHLLAPLPEGSQVVADKGSISDRDQQLAYIYGDIRLIPKQRRNMAGNTPEDARLIGEFRPAIETLFSQLEKMGVQRLHARTNDGIAVKILASLLAVTFSNWLF